jgi:hypothetical protein
VVREFGIHWLRSDSYAIARVQGKERRRRVTGPGALDFFEHGLSVVKCAVEEPFNECTAFGLKSSVR